MIRFPKISAGSENETDISALCLHSAIFILLATVSFSCRSHEPSVADDGRIPVTIALAEKVLYYHTVATSGRLSPGYELKLGFKTGGIIDNISIKEGQHVKAGDELASLNLSEIRSHLRQAELMVEKSRRDYERTSLLFADTVATLQQLENTRTAFQMAESSLEIARFNLDHSSIQAPSDGLILKILAEENEIIAPGLPVLLFAAPAGDWVLKVSITDRDIVHIDPGNRAEISFDAYPGITFDGYVREIAPMADPFTGTFGVSLRVMPGNNRLISGFIGKAVIFTSRQENYLKLPAGTIVEASGRDGYVFRYENGLARRKQVRIMEITDSGILVTGNLFEGDTIVADGSGFLKEGQPVSIAGF
jgi:membrane fusion protein, multidrug efflux system